ncbi:MAG: ABC transporter ATP-binding protein [Chloroflexi bacterium]|nr:ABC transporter ATP-binding protein [Chloroflexota bacterium]
MLKVEDLHVHYGSSHAVRGVSLELNRGETRAILGANGAGKSSVLRTIMGLNRPTAGRIVLDGQREIQGVPAHQVARLGVALVPEGRGVLATMTVEENLLMGAYVKRGTAEIHQRMDSLFERFPRLRERRQQLAGTLSGGEQQMLAIARGLMAEPELLLLDEPSLGLAPLVIEEVYGIIRQLGQAGTTILLVEQNAARALEVASWGYVLATGSVVVSGPTEQLLQTEAVREAYLGG